jgi:hypothetical protein
MIEEDIVNTDTSSIIRDIEDLINSAKKELILINSFLRINDKFLSIIEEKYNEGIDIGIVYANEKGGTLKRLSPMKNIRIYAEPGNTSIIYLNERKIILTSMPLHPIPNNFYFSTITDKDKNNPLYLKIYNDVDTIIRKGSQTSGPRSVITPEYEVYTKRYFSNKDILALFRTIDNKIINNILDNYHTCAIWLTNDAFKRKSRLYGLWINIEENTDIPYTAPIIKNRFANISLTDETEIKNMGGKIPVMLISLGDNKKINDDIIITVPYDFDFKSYEGVPHFYFKRGKILHRIALQDLGKENLQWIKNYENKNFKEFVNFFYENKKK